MQPKIIQNKSTRNFIIFLVGVGVVGLLYFLRPYPLDAELDYVGKDDYGCWICDSMPNSVYYYQTNLSANDVVRHFKKAKIKNTDDLYTNNDPSIPITLSMISPRGDLFYVDYYTNGKDYAGQSNMYPSRSHVITILKDQYPAAKESL